MNRKIKVLIVDDSAYMRQQLIAILSDDAHIEVIGLARDGEEAVQKAIQLQPDVITMDIEMPKMDGLTSLQYIMELAPCPIIILSAHTQRGAMVTFEALELGAFDFVTKPSVMGSAITPLEQISKELKERIVAAAASRKLPASRERAARLKKLEKSSVPYSKVIVIGVSTGGPKTVMDILPHFPSDFPVPIILIQHMPEMFTASFAERLNQNLPMRVVEAANRMVLEPGTIYVAPGGRQLYTEKALGTNQLRFSVRSGTEKNIHTPSVDITMLSLLQHFPAERIIGVLLTGIGSDGAEGMVEIRKGGGLTIAESEETSIVYGMPRSAAERGGAQYVLPSYMIGQTILKEVL